MTKLFVGTDPELMLSDKDGNLKSAIGIVEGTKDKKVDLGNGHKMFYDNVNVEVNITPGDSANALVNNVGDCLARMAKAVYPLKLNLRASATFPKKECEHPDALVFGCDPEFCAYEMMICQPPSAADGNTFRSCGGHIHLGYAEQKWPLMAPVEDGDPTKREWGRVWVIRMMDLFVGIPSLWIDQDPTSPTRRKLYGKAGTHRPKDDYGVEYRATGNFWLRSPQTVALTYNLSKFVVDFVGENRHLELWKNEDECNYNVTSLREAINTTNKNLGKTFLNGYVKKLLPANLYKEILTASEPTTGSFLREWNLPV